MTGVPARPGLGRFLGRSSAAAMALVAAAVGFVLLTAAVTGRPGRVVGADGWLADRLNALVSPHPVLVQALRVVTMLGDTPVLGLVVTALAAYLVLRGRARLAGYAVVTGLGGLVLTPAAKDLVGRLRPVVDVPLAAVGDPSFPSGHALGSTVAYGVVLMVAWPLLGRRARIGAAAATVALLVAVGATRLALGVHYLSDVVGGWMLGGLWLAATAVAFAGWRRAGGLPRSGALGAGLEPESAADLEPAPGSRPTHDRHAWQAAAVLVVGWVLLLGVLLALGRLVTDVLAGTAVIDFSSDVTRWVALNRTPLTVDLAHAASLPGGTPAVIGQGLLAAAVALALLRRWRPVLFLALVLVGELALFLTTATIIDRTRPQLPGLDPALPPTSSFPSGHLSAALSLYGAVAVLVLAHARARLPRVLAVAAAVVVPFAVGVSRLHLGVHHPLDLLGSLVLALPWLLLVRAVLRPGRAAPVVGAPLPRARPVGSGGRASSSGDRQRRNGARGSSASSSPCSPC
ncbi:phosphatase PAP2 family protein [Pseudonocardia humida]|uniref:Phosphatase PAP2 family protein n=1 Tax=Pseudonocardia humida TaxID=2800819 RepID=A0ABT1ADR5_9PSEU|nr:phosphatase PAP2 family protein [Pseudonocardia humida]MCO1660899.1 phosphatase PAP2 family protein [Pseudonocardia humida]